VFHVFRGPTQEALRVRPRGPRPNSRTSPRPPRVPRLPRPTWRNSPRASASSAAQLERTLRVFRAFRGPPGETLRARPRLPRPNSRTSPRLPRVPRPNSRRLSACSASSAAPGETLRVRPRLPRPNSRNSACVRVFGGHSRNSPRIRRPYLNKSSKAFLALDGLPGAADDFVSRSTVVRGSKKVHSFRASLGDTRAGIGC
jgi:hypothetical protein